ncbi:MAG TPA: sensor histidine kinase [Bacteroidia bacterium]|jgi:sensor histidine kinase YesM|nr:sensor histidine kinase [Bacteroidia bacterium]
MSVPILFSPDLNGSQNLFTIPPFQRDLFHYVLLIGFFYLNYFLLVPKFYFKRKFALFLTISFATLIIAEFLPAFFFPENRYDITKFPEDPVFSNTQGSFHLYMLANHFFQFLGMMLFSLFLRITAEWKKAEQEKLSAELSYLKAQINPHFLFNTLNSIYSLAIQRSDATASAVVKLSGMMRYVTTESQTEKVSLEKELTYISDYIDLQKLRVGNTVDVSMNVTGNTQYKKITPIILIPFVENAFKYGVNPEEESKIVIDITVEGNTLKFRVANKKVHIDYGAGSKSGHGIPNVHQRLDLSYPGKHTLKITDNDKEFIVDLEISL